MHSGSGSKVMMMGTGTLCLSGSNSGHSYRSSRANPFALEQQEGKHLTSKDLIYGGSCTQSNFHKDTGYYSSPRKNLQNTCESKLSSQHIHAGGDRGIGNVDAGPYQEVVSNRNSVGRYDMINTLSGRSSNYDPPCSQAVQNALQKYPSMSNRARRNPLSLADWISVAKKKNGLVDDMYLKAAKEINDGKVMSHPVKGACNSDQVVSDVPNFKKLGSWYAMNTKGNRRLDPIPSYTSLREALALKADKPSTNIRGVPGRNMNFGNGDSETCHRRPPYSLHYYETPYLPPNISQTGASVKAEKKEEPRIAIDNQMTETRLAYQNPNEPRKLLLGLPDRDMEKFVRWYKGPNKAINPVLSSSPKNNSHVPTEKPSRAPHLENLKRNSSSKLQNNPQSDRSQSLKNEKADMNVQTDVDKDVGDLSKQRVRNNVSSHRQISAETQEPKGSNVEQPLWESQRYKLPPKEPTKARQFFTSLIRNEQNRINEDVNLPQDWPLWFTESEWILQNEQSNKIPVLIRRQKSNRDTRDLLPPDSCKWSEDHFASMNDLSISVQSDPLPKNDSETSRSTRNAVSLYEPHHQHNISRCIRGRSKAATQDKSLDCGNNSIRPRFRPIRPWCPLGSKADTCYVFQTPRRKAISRFEKQMVTSDNRINPIVQESSSHGGNSSSTTFLPSKVLLYCKKGIMTIPSPYDVPSINSFCQPKDLIM